MEELEKGNIEYVLNSVRVVTEISLYILAVVIGISFINLK